MKSITPEELMRIFGRDSWLPQEGKHAPADSLSLDELLKPCVRCGERQTAQVELRNEQGEVTAHYYQFCQCSRWLVREFGIKSQSPE